MAPARGTAKPESLPKRESASVGLGLFVILATIGLLLFGFAALADEFGETGRLAQLDRIAAASETVGCNGKALALRTFNMEVPRRREQRKTGDFTLAA